MRHSKARFEGVNDKCETLQQARKDPEAEVRSAALATHEPITYNPWYPVFFSMLLKSNSWNVFLCFI